MMSEMVERVARAMCKADGKDPDADCKIGTCSGDVRMKEWQYHYPFVAMRAIEAMREPTEAMMRAFWDCASSPDFYPDESSGSEWYGDAKDLRAGVSAMIDAALSTTGK